MKRARAPSGGESTGSVTRVARDPPSVQSGTDHLREASSEERTLGFVRGQGGRPAVSRSGLLTLAEPAEQVGPGGVEQVVVVQVTGGREVVDERQTGRGAADHGHRDGPVELHDR